MSEAHKPAFEFSDGFLQITTRNASTRLCWKPEASAEELLSGMRWAPCWPDFRILRHPLPAVRRNAYGLDVNAGQSDEILAAQKETAFLEFREQLPPAVVQATEAFCSHQWPLLAMISRQPLALDLAVSNPVLAYALANNNIFRHTGIEAAGFQAAAYSLRKQRWILEWLGFPGTGAAEKLIRKIPAGDASPYLLRRLKNALQSDPEAIGLLGHQRVINATVLEIVTNQHILGAVTPVLLEAAGGMTGQDGNFTLGDKILAIITTLQEIAPERIVPQFRSIEEVDAYHDEVFAEYDAYQQRQAQLREERRQAVERERRREAENNRFQRNLDRSKVEIHVHKPFPPPPLPGTTSIQPINSLLDLQIEGEEQNNCVASYAWKVLRGGFYIYRVTAPERATLAIFRCTDGCWRRSELKGTGNRKVKRSTANMVDAWLDSYCVSV